MSAAGALCLLLALSPARAEDETGPAWQGWITEVEGHVVVFAGGDDDEAFPAAVDTPLEPGDRVETGPGGRAEIALEADSVLSLEPKSVFTIEAPHEADWDFSLGLGALVAKIRRAYLGARTLRVLTPTAVAAVRGTEFGVEVDADGGTGVGVFDEGRVAVAHAVHADIDALELAAGDETHVGAGDKLRVETSDGRRRLRKRRLTRLKDRRRRLEVLRRRRAALRRRWAALPAERRAEVRRGMKTRFVDELKALPPAKRREAIKRMRRRALAPGARERLERHIEKRRGRRFERPGGERPRHERLREQRRRLKPRRERRRH